MKRLLLILCVSVVCAGAKLPTPKFSPRLPTPKFAMRLPVPHFTVIHTAKPIVKPTKLTHTSHRGKCMCPGMCYGLHLTNQHGITNAQWNKQRLWEGRKMYDLHAKLHREGVYEKPKASGCGPGGCPTTRRPILRRRWFR